MTARLAARLALFVCSLGLALSVAACDAPTAPTSRFQPRFDAPPHCDSILADGTCLVTTGGH